MAEGPYSTLHNPAMPPAPDDRMASVAGPRRSLTEMMDAYLAARAAHDAVEAAHGDDAYSCPEWDAYLEAERALVSHRCVDDGERRTKIAFAMVDRPFLDTIERGTLDGVSVASRFLSSLI